MANRQVNLTKRVKTPEIYERPDLDTLCKACDKELNRLRESVRSDGAQAGEKRQGQVALPGKECRTTLRS